MDEVKAILLVSGCSGAHSDNLGALGVNEEDRGSDLPPWEAASCSHIAPVLVCLAVFCQVVRATVYKDLCTVGPLRFVMARCKLL